MHVQVLETHSGSSCGEWKCYISSQKENWWELTRQSWTSFHKLQLMATATWCPFAKPSFCTPRSQIAQETTCKCCEAISRTQGSWSGKGSLEDEVSVQNSPNMTMFRFHDCCWQGRLKQPPLQNYPATIPTGTGSVTFSVAWVNTWWLLRADSKYGKWWISL